jgi:hypothetical protein
LFDVQLTREWLGKRLDKQQQCSDWDRRPLTAAQASVSYLDTHILRYDHWRGEGQVPIPSGILI